MASQGPTVPAQATGEGSVSGPEVPSATIASLARRVEILEKDAGSWFKRLGIIVGIVGGLVAVPKGVYDLWSAFATPSPKTAAQWGESVTIAQDPQKYLVLSSEVTLSNQGLGQDGVAKDSFKLTLPNLKPPENLISVDQPEIKFVELSDNKSRTPEQVDQEGIPVPIYLGATQRKRFLVRAEIARALAERALKQSGVWKVEFSLTLQSGGPPLSRQFCWTLDNARLTDISNGNPNTLNTAIFCD